MPKAISAIIATIMLLMISVSLIGVFYVFSSTLATTTTSAGGEQVSQLTSQFTMCMRIDNINGNKVDLRNCGKGVIENKSLLVMMDDVKLGASANTIGEGESGTVNITGLWQISPGKHNLKISNGATFAQALVDVQPNPDGLAGSWSFNEGSGTTANDGSGNGNAGTLTNISSDYTGSGVPITGLTFSPPAWASGKFGNALSFNGQSSYVSTTKAVDNSIQPNGQITLTAWIKPISYANPASSVPGRLIVGETGVGFQTRYAIYIDSNGKLKYGVSAGYTSGNKVIPLNEWHFVAATQSGINAKLFIDGTLDREYTASSIPSINLPLQEPVAVGMWTDWWEKSSTVFDGSIDEVRIWSRALAPDETVGMKQII